MLMYSLVKQQGVLLSIYSRETEFLNLIFITFLALYLDISYDKSCYLQNI